MECVKAPRAHDEEDSVLMCWAEANVVDGRSEVLGLWSSGGTYRVPVPDQAELGGEIGVDRFVPLHRADWIHPSPLWR